MAVTFSENQIKKLKSILIYSINNNPEHLQNLSFDIYQYIQIVEKKQKEEYIKNMR